MDTILEAQLERIETALSTLITSIITYNPSPTAADELLAADDSLNTGLEQCMSCTNGIKRSILTNMGTVTRHQTNYTTLLHLRHETALLDAKIKTSVQLLADIRKELLAIPLDKPKEEVKPVPYRNLLSYAKNISEFTIPPTFRPKLATAAADDEPKSAIEAASTQDVPAADVAMTDAAEPKADEDDPTIKALNPEQKELIASLQRLDFFPWPGEAEMHNSALATLNHQVINGNDPTDLSEVLKEERYLAEQRAMETSREERGREREGRGEVRQGGERSVVERREERERARFGLDDDDEDEDDE